MLTAFNQNIKLAYRLFQFLALLRDWVHGCKRSVTIAVIEDVASFFLNAVQVSDLPHPLKAHAAVLGLRG